MKTYFEEITDPRQKSKVKYNLVETIMMVVCAVIAGCEAWEDIADYCRVKENWFREKLELELVNGIPSHDTFARIFQLMNPKEFEKSFSEWVKGVFQPKSKQTISIDGKTVRRSRDASKNPIHMVSAWANETKLVLGQMAVEEKSNEITAVPMLLELFDSSGCVITADAMSCQKAIAQKIIDKKADYVLQLKDNQPTMHEEVEKYMNDTIAEQQQDPDLSTFSKTEKGHGRIEKRQYFLLTDQYLLKLYPDWAGLRGFGMMKSQITYSDRVTTETHCFITSLTDVKQFAKAAREHWGVESSLHWCLDMTFHEDYSRIRKDNSAENMAVIRHIALSVLKAMDDKMSVARRRRHCAYDDDYLAKVFLKIADS